MPQRSKIRVKKIKYRISSNGFVFCDIIDDDEKGKKKVVIHPQNGYRLGN